MKFNSRTDVFFNSIFFGITALLLWLIVYTLNKDTISQTQWLSALITGSVVGFLCWIYFGTSYTLTTEHLRYRSGPFYGSIEISTIQKIINGKTLWVGMRPATALNGLIIKYGKYDEVYISPDSNDRFIEEILKLNNQIIVTKNT